MTGPLTTLRDNLIALLVHLSHDDSGDDEEYCTLLDALHIIDAMIDRTGDEQMPLF